MLTWIERIADANTREELQALSLELIGHEDVEDDLDEARETLEDYARLAGVLYE